MEFGRRVSEPCHTQTPAGNWLATGLDELNNASLVPELNRLDVG
jgi:hypothetical protein